MTFISISALRRLRGFFQSCSFRNLVWAAGCCSLTPKLPFPKVWILILPVHSTTEAGRNLRWSLGPPPAPRWVAVRWDQSAQGFIWDLEDLQKSSLFHCFTVLFLQNLFPVSKSVLIMLWFMPMAFHLPLKSWSLAPPSQCSKMVCLKLSKDENAAILTEFSCSNWQQVIKILKHISCV